MISSIPIRSCGRATRSWASVAVAAAAFALLLLAPSSASGQEDFFRSSPGDLSRSHASLDNQDSCNDCHTGGRGLSNDKCLDCHEHKDLRARIRAGKGLHASAKVRGRKCESCHLEHKGRNFDIMGWRNLVKGDYRKNFDHDLTGWPLNGKHKSIDCAECHKNKNRQGLRL
ncbi:MAG: cytochrome c3 family protein, partial [Myxococcota bacterium]